LTGCAWGSLPQSVTVRSTKPSATASVRRMGGPACRRLLVTSSVTMRAISPSGSGTDHSVSACRTQPRASPATSLLLASHERTRKRHTARPPPSGTSTGDAGIVDAAPARRCPTGTHSESHHRSAREGARCDQDARTSVYRRSHRARANPPSDRPPRGVAGRFRCGRSFRTRVNA
jgi:hypothetical protein